MRAHDGEDRVDMVDTGQAISNPRSCFPGSESMGEKPQLDGERGTLKSGALMSWNVLLL